MPPFRSTFSILAEAALLALVFFGIGGTTSVFWHASIGSAVRLQSGPGLTAALITEVSPPPAAPVASPPPPPDSSAALPSRALHAVSFSPQAPFADWSDPYNGACEETSVIMAMAWARGDSPAGGTIAPADANREILNLMAYETYNFGYHRDTALSETAKLFSYYYNYRNVAVRYDITIFDIKRELAAGNLIILPLAGSLIGNPNYPNAPPYHMVVVLGYDERADEFIVNDPGTRYGAGYRYRTSTLWNAIHDWTGDSETILSGRKGMLLVSPPPQAL